MDSKKLFLIDAYALIYRAYYAMMRSPRVTTYGLNTSAIYGFCLTIDEVLRKEAPDYIAVCFDPRGGHTFRHDAYPDYKAQRDKQPEDITASIPYIKRLLDALHIPAIECEGYEADDVIGTLAQRAEAQGFTIYMMTPDKDYGQLVTDNILQYRPALGGKGFEVRGPAEVCARHGISSPAQVIDLLALEGDASDNVPGCPGVGEKTAAKLIADWGNVENLIANVDSLKGTLKTKIADNAEKIRFSKFLVTIKTDVPVDTDLNDLKRREPDMAALAALFDELQFKSLASRFGITAEAPVAAPTAQASLFDEIDDAPATQPAPTAVVADTVVDISRAVTSALSAESVGVAAYVTGEEAMTAMLRGIAIADGTTVIYVPMPDFAAEQAEVLAALKPLFEGKSTIVNSDVKRLMILLRRHGIEWTAPYFDTAVAHYVLAPEAAHDPASVAFAIAGVRTADYNLSATERRRWSFATIEEAAAAMGERADMVLKLKPMLIERLAEQDLLKLYTDIEAPLTAVLADMEWQGMRIDTAALATLSRRLSARVNELEQEVYALAGTEFNISSPMQVGQILFDRLQIPTTAKKTKRGFWSTTEEVLEKLAHKYPIVGKILEIRGLRKLLATYIEALPTLINPATGKIHTTLNQVATATGRISSVNPNLQNIPVRTDDGREIRRAFIADDGDILLSADYSQIELRLMADISGDPEMIAAFNAGEDIHRATAAKIYHKPIDEVTDTERRHAKTANFGIIYGISAFGLSERLAIPRLEAKSLIENYLKTYSGVKQYMDDIVKKAREQGYVCTIHGRKRFLPDISSRNAALRGYAERNAINAPLQGSAADIIKIAMIAIHRRMGQMGLHSRMIMQVHDELVFNVVPDELDALTAMVTEEMRNAYHGRVTLEVSAGTGHNWLDAH